MDPENHGWNIVSDGEIYPTWFTGNQIPPSLRKLYKNRKINRSRSQNIRCIDDAFDGDISCESDIPVIVQVSVVTQSYEADIEPMETVEIVYRFSY